jgi:hypothetical protein
MPALIGASGGVCACLGGGAAQCMPRSSPSNKRVREEERCLILIRWDHSIEASSNHRCEMRDHEKLSLDSLTKGKGVGSDRGGESKCANHMSLREMTVCVAPPRFALSGRHRRVASSRLAVVSRTHTVVSGWSLQRGCVSNHPPHVCSARRAAPTRIAGCVKRRAS